MRYRHVVAGLLASLAASGLGPVRPAHAQIDAAMVRVEKPDIVVRSRPSAKSDVVAPAPAGTMLFVMDREDNWVWVLLPPDINGTRHPGWVRSADLGAPGDAGSTPAPESKKERNARKRASADENGPVPQPPLAENRRLKQEQTAESRRLKQEQAAASRQARREADAERRLKTQQAAEERRLQQQQVLADRRTKQQAEEDRRLERAKRELEKAKQEFDKAAKSESSEPAK